LASFSEEKSVFAQVLPKKADVPRRTWGFMAKFGLFFTVLALLACERPNLNPELTDPIYVDLSAQAETAGKTMEAEKKKLEGFKKTLDEAKPYSGELRVAQNRYFDSEKKVQQAAQTQYYFKLRAKTRKDVVRTAYTKSFSEKKPWDTQEESKSYQQHEKITKIPLSWDSKRRIANYEKESGFGSSIKKAPETKEPKKKE
jgi:hypothetical protein